MISKEFAVVLEKNGFDTSNEHGYISFRAGETQIILDGSYTVDQLKIIIKSMEES